MVIDSISALPFLENGVSAKIQYAHALLSDHSGATDKNKGKDEERRRTERKSAKKHRKNEKMKKNFSQVKFPNFVVD